MYFQTEATEMPKQSRKADQEKGLKLQPTYPKDTGKGKKSTTSDIVVPPGDQASKQFKQAVLKQVFKTGLAKIKKK